MRSDDVVLGLQSWIDRVIRRVRLGPPPLRQRRRLLVIQIDGLSRAVLDQALARGHLRFLAHLLGRHAYRVMPMSVGMPTSTPAFQMAAMYGVRPDIPGFHYHDRRRKTDIYFPRRGDAALVEATQGAGRAGVLAEGSAYGCVFTGGARNNVFNFATIKQPSGRGLLRVVSAFVVLAWVVTKGAVLTLAEVLRALARFVVGRRGRRGALAWLGIKVVMSIWVRQFFTLEVSRDLYAGVPAIWVNYLDYDVAAHAFGPHHRRALRSLRRIDSSIRQLCRVLRRVPEHAYDVYILSDHGQITCTPYERLDGGVPLERRLMAEFFAPVREPEVDTGRPRGRRLAGGIKAIRRHAGEGVFQRFVNYLEDDFPSLLGRTPEAREREGVRIIAAGPNAFVYFLESDAPLSIERIDERFPGLADDIARSRGIGFVLVRSADGPVCLRTGKRYRLARGEHGPFDRRPDIDVVVAGLEALMAMPSAGDLVLYGHGSADGNVSYVPEIGAHAGPAADELHTFIIHPAGVRLPSPLTDPVQLYPYFLAYQEHSRQAS